MKNLTLDLGRLLPRKRSSPLLGTRELELMKILWQGDTLSARQLQRRLSDRSLSLSTLQSTLERLYRKRLLCRQKQGRFYTYRAAISRSQMISSLLSDIADNVGDGDLGSMVSGFVSFIDSEAPGSLSERARQAIRDVVPEEGDDV